MRFLIAGFGSIGRRHFRNLKALGNDDIIFYRSGKSSLPVDELKGLIVEEKIQVALSHHPDAVIVANPTALHLEVAVPAAEAGCHLLLEKPISNSTDHLGDLQAAAKKTGSRILVGFQFRFHPGLLKAREILKSGTLGDPISARAYWGEYFPAWHPWEDYRQSYGARKDLGGGVVFTLCHPFDYLRWLLGEVVSLMGQTRHSGVLLIDVEDQADADLQFENGSHATVHLDYLQSPPSHWLEIICSQGRMHWDAGSGLLQVWSPLGEEGRFPVASGFERNDMFLAEMSHFIEIARSGAAPVCTLEDGAAALNLALAVHASAKEGKRISLSKDWMLGLT